MKDLNKKWWFRLVIVFYVLVGLSGLTVVIFGIIDEAPSFSLYESTFSYRCDDGYTSGTLKYGFNKEITSDDYSPNKKSSFKIENKDMDKTVRMICSNINMIRDNKDRLSNEEKKYISTEVAMGKYDESIPQEINYTIFIKDAKYNGTLGGAILYGFLYMAILVASLFSIRYVFLYVITGKHKLIFNEKIRKTE